MSSEDHASVTRGALRLKGAKVKKHKKKEKSSLEKALWTGERSAFGDATDAKETVPTRSTSEPKQADADEDEDVKTEAERRFAENKRKKLRELVESGKARPEMLKTHKQRVEELNSHLSKLSEHHDMPKIGPG